MAQSIGLEDESNGIAIRLSPLFVLRTLESLVSYIVAMGRRHDLLNQLAPR